LSLCLALYCCNLSSIRFLTVRELDMLHTGPYPRTREALFQLRFHGRKEKNEPHCTLGFGSCSIDFLHPPACNRTPSSSHGLIVCPASLVRATDPESNH